MRSRCWAHSVRLRVLKRTVFLSISFCRRAANVGICRRMTGSSQAAAAKPGSRRTAQRLPHRRHLAARRRHHLFCHAACLGHGPSLTFADATAVSTTTPWNRQLAAAQSIRTSRAGRRSNLRPSRVPNAQRRVGVVEGVQIENCPAKCPQILRGHFDRTAGVVRFVRVRKQHLLRSHLCVDQTDVGAVVNQENVIAFIRRILPGCILSGIDRTRTVF